MSNSGTGDTGAQEEKTGAFAEFINDDMKEDLKKVLGRLEKWSEDPDLKERATEAARLLNHIFNMHHDPDDDFDVRDYMIGDPWADAIILKTAEIHSDYTSSFDFEEVLAFAYKAAKGVCMIIKLFI
jgi:hypothetical protein